MKRIVFAALFCPAMCGCSFFGGNFVKVSGEAVWVKTEVPEHQHVQVDGQCLTCLRHTNEDLAGRVKVLEVQLERYRIFSKENTERVVNKLTREDFSSGQNTH